MSFCVRLRRVKNLFVSTLLFGIAACGTPAAPYQLSVADPPGRLFARAYEQLMDLYIEPVHAGNAAMAGLQRLGTVDAKIAIVRDEDAVTMRYDDAVVRRLPAPDDDDGQGWGAATSALLREARVHSPAIADKTEDQLDQVVFDGIVGSLDRFSRYSPPDVARDQRASRDGFGGIGVTLDYSDKEVRVSAVIPQGPADRAGVRVEDRVTRIDGAETASLSRSDVVRRLRGPVDSRVELTLSRPGRGASVEVGVYRSFIVPPTVSAERQDHLGVVRITGFNHDTARSVEDAVLKLRREAGRSLHGLVLDLRGNPGGLLDQSVSVADLFITRGPILTTRGRHPASRQYYNSTPDDVANGLPIVVLVNGGSASAAEIVAAALQDSGRAVIVGSTSYGKGTVQSVLPLPNDAELTLTWAKFYSPAGYTLHEHGVVPTVCTSTLGEAEANPATAIRRAALQSESLPIVRKARIALDEQGWSELRKTCPAETGENKLDLEVATRLLNDSTLYARTLHPLTALPAEARAH
jgi:carboxyl-terminal processing protease